MALIQPGTPAPDFRLIDETGEKVTRESLLGQTSVLVFYPFAFSPVCTDQFQVYEEVLDDFTAQGAKLFGVSTDAIYSQKAFKEQLGASVLYPKRLGTPDELASMVLECLTNSYMNAETIRVDGGIRMPPK